MNFYPVCLSVLFVLFLSSCTASSSKIRKREDFGKDWKFYLGDVGNGQEVGLDDSPWRLLDLPHDWSIEGEFREDNPATPGGGVLPGGVAWYRKTFVVPESHREKLVFIDFDGIYRNSKVWINGHFLGQRPYGYSSFRYELTPFLKYGNEKNLLAVRVDNSQQPNSRWYSGSGIYRNVWLVTTEKIFVDHWGTFITTPEISQASAKVSLQTQVRNATPQDQLITLKTMIYDAAGKKVSAVAIDRVIAKNSVAQTDQHRVVRNPALWSPENPYLYKASSQVMTKDRIWDDDETAFGIRYFAFDSTRGFSLNGRPTKILGVCLHHDLGCLDAVINTRALQRQLEMLKAMDCNGIRTSHNPPAPELLDLCDRMGFIVVDEAFDMWAKEKTEYDYALDWEAWHRRDLEDMVRRDRNHPSVFIWSTGNEVVEQWDAEDSKGEAIARELAGLIRHLDATRPITAACNNLEPSNPIIKSGALDVIGSNYGHHRFADFPKTFPGQCFLATETTSALATRGSYDMPSDIIRRWPMSWDQPFKNGSVDLTCSAYDNCSVPWGSTHEETRRMVKKYDFLSGMYIWAGWDYLGEPTPYGWPARSSYFGIIDLAGFPKDAYYVYQSEWTKKPVLHVFPHWNWNEGELVDVWVYTNCEEVELFLNGKSLGAKKKMADDLHLTWRLSFSHGTLTAIGRSRGKDILSREVKTAGQPSKVALEPDRNRIRADGRDLSFVTVKVLDQKVIVVPWAGNLINFDIKGEGIIAGVDNGCQTSHEPFKAKYRKAFHGLCLVVVQSTEKTGEITLTAASEGLEGDTVRISTRKTGGKLP